MDHTAVNTGNPLTTAIILMFANLGTTAITIVAVMNVQTIVACLTGTGSVVTAFFACRYYYYATKEKKDSIKIKYMKPRNRGLK